MGGEGVARDARMAKRHSVRGHCCTVLCGYAVLRICGKCRATFGRDACTAFALPSPHSTIIRLPSVASSSRLQHHHRAIRLVSRHFPRLHVAFRSASIPLVALLSHPL